MPKSICLILKTKSLKDILILKSDPKYFYGERTVLNSKGSAPLHNRCTKTKKKKKAQRKEQIKAPEKTQLSNKEIANLSDAQFKTLVIRKLTELVEFGHKLDEKMKAMLRETKETVQGTNSDGKETGTQINGVDQKEERNIWPENEETRIQKNEERHRNLQDIFKHSNIGIIGVPEGEEEEQQIENLFEQIMKENFPNLAKEIDFQEVQEAQRLPKKSDPRRHIIITFPKIKEKERILEAAREKDTVT